MKTARSWAGSLVVWGWALATLAGTVATARYKGTPGAAAEPPSSWPAQSSIAFPTSGAALVMVVHPKCPARARRWKSSRG